mmetsp:Transcript_23717/g.55247  ORF Transcript_23717/g.55247 Transcript_23717/m.55247 type:complete len:237 (+) Transcript_23717:114-824(+)
MSTQFESMSLVLQVRLTLLQLAPDLLLALGLLDDRRAPRLDPQPCRGQTPQPVIVGGHLHHQFVLVARASPRLILLKGCGNDPGYPRHGHQSLIPVSPQPRLRQAPPEAHSCALKCRIPQPPTPPLLSNSWICGKELAFRLRRLLAWLPLKPCLGMTCQLKVTVVAVVKVVALPRYFHVLQKTYRSCLKSELQIWEEWVFKGDLSWADLICQSSLRLLKTQTLVWCRWYHQSQDRS